jgi:hypothetical protein
MAGNPRVPHLELELNGAQGVGVHRPAPELPRRGTRRFADLRRSQRARPRFRRARCGKATTNCASRPWTTWPDENGDSQISWDALALLRTGSALPPIPPFPWNRLTSSSRSERRAHAS